MLHLRWHTWETRFSLTKHSCTIFLHGVGSSWVTPDDPAKQWFSALSKSGWSGPTPDDLDPDWSDRFGGPVWPVWTRAAYLLILKWEMMLWVIIWRTLSLKGPKWIHKSDSKYCKHNFNSCKLFLCFDQSCKWASLYSLSNKVPPSKDIQNLRHWLRGSSFSNLCHSWD